MLFTIIDEEDEQYCSGNCRLSRTHAHGEGAGLTAENWIDDATIDPKEERKARNAMRNQTSLQTNDTHYCQQVTLQFGGTQVAGWKGLNLQVSFWHVIYSNHVRGL